ncbi:MAG: hypothetical protein AUH43_26220 [Acidobacteria bacterium 13_1_40CM_65_14]|nr:MAG: hypothetical protein AUH43_26220 [Acidobacteria bacterium 13_1_40CM_65_14]
MIVCRAVAVVVVAVTALETANAQRGMPRRLPPREIRPPITGGGASESVAIAVQGLSRRYLLHAPKRAAGAGALALVLVLTAVSIRLRTPNR